MTVVITIDDDDGDDDGDETVLLALLVNIPWLYCIPISSIPSRSTIGSSARGHLFVNPNTNVYDAV